MTTYAGQSFFSEEIRATAKAAGWLSPFRAHGELVLTDEHVSAQTLHLLGQKRMLPSESMNWCGRDTFICLHICVLLCLLLCVTGRRDRHLHICYPTLAVRRVRGSQCLEIFVQESAVTLEQVIRVCPQQRSCMRRQVASCWAIVCPSPLLKCTFSVRYRRPVGGREETCHPRRTRACDWEDQPAEVLMVGTA